VKIIQAVKIGKPNTNKTSNIIWKTEAVNKANITTINLLYPKLIILITILLKIIAQIICSDIDAVYLTINVIIISSFPEN
jgi:hypothetical protein